MVGTGVEIVAFGRSRPSTARNCSRRAAISCSRFSPVSPTSVKCGAWSVVHAGAAAATWATEAQRRLSHRATEAQSRFGFVSLCLCVSVAMFFVAQCLRDACSASLMTGDCRLTTCGLRLSSGSNTAIVYHLSMRKLIPAAAKTVITLCVLLLTSGVVFTQQVDPAMFSGMRWRLIGPFRAGRVSAGAIDPDPNTYYIGLPGGGVWKTTDAGQVWAPIFDAVHVASIGAIAVSPSNSKIVYVGTGEQTPGN